MRPFNLATTELSTHQHDLTPDDVILRTIKGAGNLDSASLHFLELVYRALASRRDGHHE
jgi:hypothetical protein